MSRRVSESYRRRLGGKRGPQRRGPLKKVIDVLRPSDDTFDRDKVLLECGHTLKSNGQRARCFKCLRGDPPEIPTFPPRPAPASGGGEP